MSAPPKGAATAQGMLLEVMPASQFTFDQGEGWVRLYVWVGNNGPSASADWEGGRFAGGRTGERRYTTEAGFLNGLKRLLARRAGL